MKIFIVLKDISNQTYQLPAWLMYNIPTEETNVYLVGSHLANGVYMFI